jgi:hypothetical protein
MATSTIPTLKANLVTQLQARAGLTGIQVTNGPPLPSPSREYIWVGDVDGVEEMATAGINTRHEDYNTKVVIHVEKDGTDTAATDARCFVLSAELENQLRTDPTVSGAVSLAQLTAYRLTEFVQPDGMARIAELVVTVNCQQWI